jgi:hypothetical protein
MYKAIAAVGVGVLASVAIGITALVEQGGEHHPTPTRTYLDECRNGNDPGDPTWWPTCTTRRSATGTTS